RIPVRRHRSGNGDRRALPDRVPRCRGACHRACRSPSIGTHRRKLVNKTMTTRASAALLGLLLSAGVLVSAQADRQPQDQQAFKFRTAVDLVNVNATVTDQSGRFVRGLNIDDFRVYDDEQLQSVTHFSAERVPVSLGVLLDTSGSMEGEKIVAARQALARFLVQLLD